MASMLRRKLPPSRGSLAGNRIGIEVGLDLHQRANQVWVHVVACRRLVNRGVNLPLCKPTPRRRVLFRRRLPQVLAHFSRGRFCSLNIGMRNGLPPPLSGAPENQTVLLRSKRLPRSQCHNVIYVHFVAPILSGGGNRCIRSCLHAWRERKEGRDSWSCHQGELQAFSHTGTSFLQRQNLSPANPHFGSLGWNTPLLLPSRN